MTCCMCSFCTFPFYACLFDGLSSCNAVHGSSLAASFAAPLGLSLYTHVFSGFRSLLHLALARCCAAYVALICSCLHFMSA